MRSPNQSYHFTARPHHLVGGAYLALLLLVVSVPTPASAQSTGPHPLDGLNQVSVTGSFGLTGGHVGDRAILPAHPSIEPGGLVGDEHAVGLHLSRPMPDFFISRGMTVHVGVEYLRYSLRGDGVGIMHGTDESPPVEISQESTLRARIVALSGGIRINTSRGRSRLMPTVDLGVSFGHILDLDVETRTDPDIGFPENGFVPDRRYYYNSINLGLGLGLSLGPPDRSPMVIPSLSMRAATTSLTRNRGEEVIPLSIRGGIELRLPLSSEN